MGFDRIQSISLVSAQSKPLLFEPQHEKTNFVVSDQVRHKPSCTITEDG